MSFVVLATISGCATPSQRAQRLAQQHGLAPVLLHGKRFQHHSFAALRSNPAPHDIPGPHDNSPPHGAPAPLVDPAPHANSALLVLFIDGDGSPWVHGGRQIAADPTPRTPLALELAAATDGSVLYLGRPCYMEKTPPPGCSPDMWTAQRYSEPVVDSMSAAANAFVAEHHFERVLLVGYSGGATLAALMARNLPGVVGLISVAGNLDPDTWAQFHGYLPLQGSLNPALQPSLPVSLPQWYLVGERDTNVPAAATARYLQRIAPERVWSYPSFDHACCWVTEWPAIFARVSAELAATP